MAFVPLALPPLPRSLIPREVAPPPERPSPPATESEAGEVAESMEVEEAVADTSDEPSQHELVVENARPAERTAPEVAVDLVDASDTAVVSAYVPDAPPTAELLNNTMSVRQLKDRCTELGLNTVGRKMELAERIAAVQ